MHFGPETPHGEHLHASKYRRRGESFRDAMNRVAYALKDSDEHFRAFRSILLSQRFLPGGRVQSAIGSGRDVTAFNCFVSGTIADALTGSDSSIMGRASQAAETMRRGGGIGYDFSTLRPRGAPIMKLSSNSTGPISFMHVFDAVGLAISSSGHRRGAQMGVLRVDHPDIEEFIRAKQTPGALTGFNLSIGVTDEFMKAVDQDLMFDLRFERKVHSQVRARDLWETVMRNTWDYAEPGILFLDTINNRNNLHYCERIAATNPCGEQPLPPFGACLLGSINVVKYLRVSDSNKPIGIDYDQLAIDMPHIVRAMDNVTDATRYPLIEQEQEARSKRRMGLGVTGLATALEACGMPYGSDQFVAETAKIFALIRDAAYHESARLAAEKGPFPLFDRDSYLDSHFVGTLPASVRDEIARHGIRNSHLLSVAPTGTISMTADNVSSGIEPVFAHRVRRHMAIGGEPQEVVIDDYGYRKGWGEAKLAADCSIADHLAVLAVAANHVDSAVSKTCNVPSSMAWDDFKRVYSDAYKLGAKGITTFQDGGKRAGIMVAEKPAANDDVATEDGDSCSIDPVTGRRNCA